MYVWFLTLFLKPQVLWNYIGSRTVSKYNDIKQHWLCGFIWIASIQIHLNNKNVCIISGRTLYNAQSMCMSTEFVHSVFYSKAPSTVIILMHLADFAHCSSLPFSQMHTIVWNSSVVENSKIHCPILIWWRGQVWWVKDTFSRFHCTVPEHQMMNKHKRNSANIHVCTNEID